MTCTPGPADTRAYVAHIDGLRALAVHLVVFENTRLAGDFSRFVSRVWPAP